MKTAIIATVCRRLPLILNLRISFGLLFVTLTVSLSFKAFHHRQLVTKLETVLTELPGNCVKTCYRRHEDGTRALLPKEYLTANDCERRLPDAIILGAKKCGTGALRVFLDTHPAVAFSTRAEPKFFTENYDKGLDWYRKIMRYTTPDQISIEKSPGYFYSSDAVQRMEADLPPTTKFIVILCNPVRRTVSDFTYMQIVAVRDRQNIDTEAAQMISRRTYNSRPFERYVLTASGRIRSNLGIIKHSMYDKYIFDWMKVFPRSRFLFVDGDNFTQNPAPVLNEIERFLKIPQYFDNSTFYFDDEKGFFCLSKPSRHCLKSSKGLEHPPVETSVQRKLQELLRPHDYMTSVLTLKNYTWMK